MKSLPKRYTVILERKAEKQLKHLSKIDYSKVRDAIDKLAENPRNHNTIKLTDTQNEYRYRVGDIRMLFTIEDSILIVYIFEILNHKEAYR